MSNTDILIYDETRTVELGCAVHFVGSPTLQRGDTVTPERLYRLTGSRHVNVVAVTPDLRRVHIHLADVTPADRDWLLASFDVEVERP